MVRIAAVVILLAAATTGLTGAAGAVTGHERVPTQLINRFPLKPRSSGPGGARAGAGGARTRTASVASPVSGAARGSSSPALWLLGLLAVTGFVAGIATMLVARRPRHRQRHTEPAAPRWTAVPRPPVMPDPLGDVDAGDRAERAFSLALELEQSGDRTGAESAYRRADQLGHGLAAANLGVLHEKRGDVAAAEAAYRRAAERGDAAGSFNLGALLEQRGNLAGAEAAYRRSVELGDDEVRPLALEALRGLETGKRSGASRAATPGRSRRRTAPP